MAGPELPRLVADASVGTKWYLRDEEFLAAADLVLNDFRDNRINLIAPEQIRVEVPAAIRNAVRNRRISASQVEPAIEAFFRLGIATVPCSDELILEGTRLALRLNCTVYDGLYLALAEATACQIVYADLKLRRNLGSRFPRALWIEDYRSP